MRAVHADSVFTGWEGLQAPLSIKYGGLANIQNTVFLNMHLLSEIADVSFGGGIRFENVSLANVTLGHGAVVSTSTNDDAEVAPCYIIYEADDDDGYDVQVVAVPEGQRGPFGEQYKIVEGVMSDCLFLVAPHGLVLPGCPDASAQKRARMRAGTTGHVINGGSSGRVCGPQGVPADPTLSDQNDQGVDSDAYYDTADYYFSRDDWITKSASAPFDSLLLWQSAPWLVSLRQVGSPEPAHGYVVHIQYC